MTLNIKWDRNGLIPAVIQDAETLEVLMLGYMNEESLEKTIKTGFVTFFSRSRQTLWTKGESSGNTLALESMSIDCDLDTLLIQALPAGPTCHTGKVSCFYTPLFESESKAVPSNSRQVKEKKCTPQSKRTLEDLYETVENRKSNPVEGSYTNYLQDAGLGKILKKVGEESAEIIIASLSEDKDSLTGEIGDLLYHLTVLMVEKNVNWQEILELLDKRSS